MGHEGGLLSPDVSRVVAIREAASCPTPDTEGCEMWVANRFMTPWRSDNTQSVVAHGNPWHKSVRGQREPSQNTTAAQERDGLQRGEVL